jgi:hypothetical protein
VGRVSVGREIVIGVLSNFQRCSSATERGIDHGHSNNRQSMRIANSPTDNTTNAVQFMIDRAAKIIDPNYRKANIVIRPKGAFVDPIGFAIRPAISEVTWAAMPGNRMGRRNDRAGHSLQRF